MIKTVYVLHLNGTPVVSTNLEKLDDEGFGSFMDLFGGFSSAINTLLRELGHKEIKSITVGDGILVYSSREPLLFVVHSASTKYEQVAKLMVKQIEHDFFATYEDLIADEKSFIFGDKFSPFESRIAEIYDDIVNIQEPFPQLLEFLPGFMPLKRLHEVLNLGLDIIDGYPDDTIKLIRQLDKHFSDDLELEEMVARTLGRYSGHIIAQNRFQNEPVIDHDKVLKLLNEISVAKLDLKNEVYDILLCPICRGKTAEKPVCDYFSGFIEGALNNPIISVEEITCRAMGEKTCSFKLTRN